MLSRSLVCGLLALCAVCALSACSQQIGRAGATCKRSTQCGAGLACVRGKCSKDLGPIADESTVPELGIGEGETPAADGGGTPVAGSAANGGGAGAGAGAGGNAGAP